MTQNSKKSINGKGETKDPKPKAVKKKSTKKRISLIPPKPFGTIRYLLMMT